MRKYGSSINMIYQIILLISEIFSKIKDEAVKNVIMNIDTIELPIFF